MFGEILFFAIQVFFYCYCRLLEIVNICTLREKNQFDKKSNCNNFTSFPDPYLGIRVWVAQLRDTEYRSINIYNYKLIVTGNTLMMLKNFVIAIRIVLITFPWFLISTEKVCSVFLCIPEKAPDYFCQYLIWQENPNDQILVVDLTTVW